MPDDTISTEELRNLLAAGQRVTVVDIRTAADREWSTPAACRSDMTAGNGRFANRGGRTRAGWRRMATS
jgi:hypothetical protein